ncbi:MAG: glycosyltransferase family 2 protein [Campylobacterota bacterium]|nr:glycosyltransferase family 2 protein [Campylobacterota bacterium]
MIIILLSTYNGEKYIKEQLDSLYAQTYKKFQIFVRDDGSTDRTMEILKSYNLKIIPSSSNLGATDSFFTLLEYVLENSSSQYFMFCDQDDIWEKDKIENTLAKIQEIEKLNNEIPILIHTDLKVVNENLNILNESLLSYQNINAKHNNFNNLLMQNIVTGCTMMINRKLAKMCCSIPKECILHDWWIGLVASQFGRIGYLNKSTIRYRQHTSNCVGAKKFDFNYIKSILEKNKILTKNIIQAKAFLNIYTDILDNSIVKMLEDFISINEKSFLEKRWILFKYKLYKQGLRRNIGLFLKI